MKYLEIKRKSDVKIAERCSIASKTG